jgi:hypothetical protein
MSVSTKNDLPACSFLDCLASIATQWDLAHGHSRPNSDSICSRFLLQHHVYLWFHWYSTIIWSFIYSTNSSSWTSRTLVCRLIAQFSEMHGEPLVLLWYNESGNISTNVKLGKHTETCWPNESNQMGTTLNSWIRLLWVELRPQLTLFFYPVALTSCGGIMPSCMLWLLPTDTTFNTHLSRNHFLKQPQVFQRVPRAKFTNFVLILSSWVQILSTNRILQRGSGRGLGNKFGCSLEAHQRLNCFLNL